MILQALAGYYETLAAKGEISRPGWARCKVSYALELDEQGALLSVLPLKTQDAAGKRMIPRQMELPAPYKRAVNIQPNFLCDNSSYFLGFDNKGKPERTVKCFEAAKTLHLSLLSGLESPAARAVRTFFARWNPQEARGHPLLAEYLDDLGGGANLTFLFDGEFVSREREMIAVWQRHYGGEGGTEEKDLLRCLVTGESVVPELIHPAIRGVRGAQPSGAALVSFNARAFESYGRVQNLNAPVGKYAAFAYTTALNHLLADREHVQTFGDTTVVYWAEDAAAQYQNCFAAMLGGGEALTGRDLSGVIERLSQGLPADWDGVPLNPKNRFYIIGLAPNAARLSVRFFLRDSFGAFALHSRQHYDAIRIVQDGRGRRGDIPLWALLRETVNEKSRDKSPVPQMTGDMLRAILTGGRYPATLYQQTQLRIRADREITRGRAAIIKGYLTRNTDNPDYKEALTVQLNELTTYQPYVLGRLFSVLEAIQEKANPGINTTIRDKYFSSACATPSVAFPRLMTLAQSHLKKMDKPSEIYFSKQLTAVIGMIDESYPTHHTLSDQGIFQIGYYHQTQKRYEKKTETKEDHKNG